MRPKRILIAVILIGSIALTSGLIGAALASKFGTSSETISYIDFVSILLTCLGVMMTALTLFIGALAIIGWTSIETKLRTHSIEFIGSELDEEKPLGRMVRKAVRDAVYEGVSATPEDEDSDDDTGAGAVQ